MSSLTCERVRSHINRVIWARGIPMTWDDFQNKILPPLVGAALTIGGGWLLSITPDQFRFDFHHLIVLVPGLIVMVAGLAFLFRSLATPTRSNTDALVISALAEAKSNLKDRY